jgi:K+-sensing histidine kinase KdpD
LELWRDQRPVTLLVIAAGLLLALRTNRPAAPAVEPVIALPVHQIEAEPRPLARGLQTLHAEIVAQLSAQTAAERGVRGGAAASAAAWGDLMARVSHDMRTPLNAVIGFSDVMGSELFGPVGDVRYREYITHIRDSGQELLRSAEDTLAITQLLGGADGETQRALPLHDMALAAMRRTGFDGADVRIEDGLEVLGDRQALQQVLCNLASEAKFRANGGGQASLTATAEDEFVIVEVMVAGGKQGAACSEASLNICVSRVLLELQGARLIEIERDGVWRAVTVLSRAAQPDFFMGAALQLPGYTPNNAGQLQN